MKGVNSIKVPGIEGEFGVTAGHVPRSHHRTVEARSRVDHTRCGDFNRFVLIFAHHVFHFISSSSSLLQGSEAEKFFVSGVSLSPTRTLSRFSHSFFSTFTNLFLLLSSVGYLGVGSS